MARVILDNETYSAATSGAEISGGAGTEHVAILPGVSGLSIASTIERVDFPGNVADFTFSSFGNSLTVRDLSETVIASISGAGGKTVVFGDGALVVAFDGSLTVGGVVIGSNPAPISPAEIDTGTASSTAPKQYGWVTPNTYVSGAGGGYSVKCAVLYAPGQEQLDGIARAAERLSGIIRRGEITVDVYFTNLDGYWGKASAHDADPVSHIPTRGEMRLDKAASQSISAERFEDLVFHELLHCLGFGTLWVRMGLIDGDRFTGPKAKAAYRSEFASIAARDPKAHLGVPIEGDGPSATARRHWDDATFGDEIMTSWLDGRNGLSRMTIAALADMGYEVAE